MKGMQRLLLEVNKGSHCAVQSASKLSRLLNPVLGKKPKMNRFVDLVKVFLFIGWSSGQKKMKQKPLCWSLLWDLNYCLFQIFSKLKYFLLFFFMQKPFLLSFNELIYAMESHSSKEALEIQCRESNESSNRYLWDLGDEHIGITIWLKQACSKFFFNFPENPGNPPCAWFLLGKT